MAVSPNRQKRPKKKKPAATPYRSLRRCDGQKDAGPAFRERLALPAANTPGPAKSPGHKPFLFASPRIGVFPASTSMIVRMGCQSALWRPLPARRAKIRTARSDDQHALCAALPRFCAESARGNGVRAPRCLVPAGERSSPKPRVRISALAKMRQFMSQCDESGRAVALVGAHQQLKNASRGRRAPKTRRESKGTPGRDEASYTALTGAGGGPFPPDANEAPRCHASAAARSANGRGSARTAA
jgi:hypothetical protein